MDPAGRRRGRTSPHQRAGAQRSRFCHDTRFDFCHDYSSQVPVWRSFGGERSGTGHHFRSSENPHFCWRPAVLHPRAVLLGKRCPLCLGAGVSASRWRPLGERALCGARTSLSSSAREKAASPPPKSYPGTLTASWARPRRLLYRCPSCNRDFPRVGRIRPAVACLACCRRYNAGQFEKNSSSSLCATSYAVKPSSVLR